MNLLVLFHTSVFLCSWCGIMKLLFTFYFLPYLSLGPQAFCVILSHYHTIVLVIPSAAPIFKGFFCSEDGRSMFIWSTGTYLPNCTSWHSISPYLNIHCSEILNSHIFVSKLNKAVFTVQFNSSFAVRTVPYADILLHQRATMKSLNNFNCHTRFVKHYVGKMEPFEPWPLLANLADFNQCKFVRAVSVIAIYKICDFNLSV